jgi:hypothetical protein
MPMPYVGMSTRTRDIVPNPEDEPKATTSGARRLSLRLDGADDQRLDALRQRTGQGRSELIRAALRFYELSFGPSTSTTADDDEGGSSLVEQAGEQTNAEEQATPLPPPQPPAPPISTRPSPNFDHGVGARILCLGFDPATGLFDDGSMQRFLTNKHVRQLTPYFFQQDGQAYCAVWVEYHSTLQRDEVTLTSGAAPLPSIHGRLRALRRRARCPMGAARGIRGLSL